MTTVEALCYRCFQVAPHRARGKNRLESTCRPCRIDAVKGWRKRHPVAVRLRNIWSGIKERCSNHSHPKWKNYGAKGIKLCERWQDFDAFVADLGAPPSPQHTVDRINRARDYEPGNCRWATYAEQARNREANRNITHGGVTRCLVDWGAELGIPWTTIQSRLDRGWSVARSLVVDIPQEAELPF